MVYDGKGGGACEQEGVCRPRGVDARGHRAPILGVLVEAVVEVWQNPSIASGSTGNREADCGKAVREGGHREVKGERGWTPPVSDGALAQVQALREEFWEKGERPVCQVRRDTEEAKLPEIDEGRAGKAEEHLQPAVLLGLGNVGAATAARAGIAGGGRGRLERGQVKQRVDIQPTRAERQGWRGGRTECEETAGGGGNAGGCPRALLVSSTGEETAGSGSDTGGCSGELGAPPDHGHG